MVDSPVNSASVHAWEKTTGKYCHFRGVQVAECHHFFNGGGRKFGPDCLLSAEEAKANAVLLAAAPDLAEALRAMVKWMDDSGLSKSTDGGVYPLQYKGTEYSVVTSARAALAKAGIE